MVARSGLVVGFLLLASSMVTAAEVEGGARLTPVRPLWCTSDIRLNSGCGEFDAIVFVHGIYGEDETFRNGAFDWPKRFPDPVRGRHIDVYRLNYQTVLMAWAQKANPQFDDVAEKVLEVMGPLRRSNYRSIGFIAHSLGGNVVSTYLQMVKTELGHPQRSQHAFVITLGTPVVGSQIADVAALVKAKLHMAKDDLLASLSDNNLYLRMLRIFQAEVTGKETRFDCRPVRLYVGYESEKYAALFKIVSEQSALGPINRSDTRPLPGNHEEIAKPKSETDPVFIWVKEIVDKEYARLASWQTSHPKPGTGMDYSLCRLIPLIAEH